MAEELGEVAVWGTQGKIQSASSQLSSLIFRVWSREGASRVLTLFAFLGMAKGQKTHQELGV